jgi:hypothetical protein
VDRGLFENGWYTGATEGEEFLTAWDIQSANDFLTRSETENEARFQFNVRTGIYSNFQTPAGAIYGRQTSVTMGDRTVNFAFTETSTRAAREAGIDTDRVLLNLTDHRAYDAAVNAAFATAGVTGVGIESTYRPTGAHRITGGTTGGRSLDIAYLETAAGRFNFRDDVRSKAYYDGSNQTGARYNYQSGALNGLEGAPNVAWGANDPRTRFTSNLYAQRGTSGVNQILMPYQSYQPQSELRGTNILRPSEVVDVPGLPSVYASSQRAVILSDNKLFIGHRNHLHFTVQQRNW